MSVSIPDRVLGVFRLNLAYFCLNFNLVSIPDRVLGVFRQLAGKGFDGWKVSIPDRVLGVFRLTRTRHNLIIGKFQSLIGF